GSLEILQLWVNLPSRLKMVQPRYVGLRAKEIPAIPTPDDKCALYLVAGEWQGKTGAVQPLLDIFLSWAERERGARLEVPGGARRQGRAVSRRARGAGQDRRRSAVARHVFVVGGARARGAARGRGRRRPQRLPVRRARHRHDRGQPRAAIPPGRARRAGRYGR